MPKAKTDALVKKNKARAAAKKVASAKESAKNKATMKKSTRKAQSAAKALKASGKALGPSGKKFLSGNVTRPLERANKAFKAELKKNVKSPAKKTVRATRKK